MPENDRDGLLPLSMPSDQKAPPAGQDWFVLSSNWSIGPLLSRGCLLPPASGESTGVPFFDELHASGHLVAENAVPCNWIRELRGSRRNIYPIAIRVRGNKSSQKLGEGLSLDLVVELLFETDEEMEMFRSSSFTDFDVDAVSIPMAVLPDVFRGSDEPLSGLAAGAAGEPLPSEPPEIAESTAEGAPAYASPSSVSMESASSRLRIEDSRAALLVTLLRECPMTPAWVEAILSVWEGEPRGDSRETTWVTAIASGLEGDPPVQQPSMELAILSATSFVASRHYGLEAGWPAKEVLERVLEEAPRRLAGQVAPAKKEALEDWMQFCKRVLDAKEVPRALMDTRNIPLRAILLLLIRGELDRVMSSPIEPDSEGSFRVGMNVRLLAAALAAVRSGLRNLPAEMKVPADSGAPRLLLEGLGRRILRRVRIGRGADDAPKDALEAKQTTLAPFAARWSWALNGVAFLEMPRFFPRDIHHLASLCKDAGLVISEHGEAGIHVSRTVSGSKVVRVLLTLNDDEFSGIRFVRLSSPVVDLAPKRRMKKRKWPSAALNKITKNDLIRWLERNSQKRMSLWFALSVEEQALLAITDVSLEAIDQKRLVGSIERVAVAALGA